MKKVTATEARKRWFRLLDEVAAGEVVMLQRRGRRLVLRREEGPRRRGTATGTYHRLLQVPRAAEADRWSWAWVGPGRALRSVRRSGR